MMKYQQRQIIYQLVYLSWYFFNLLQLLILTKNKLDKTKEKDSVIDLLNKIPDDASYEDIIAEIYFKKQAEEGIVQLDKGQTLINEEVKKRMEKWLNQKK